MSVPRRFNKLQDLARLDVLIEDDAVISRFFNITEFPEVLTQGKSSFLIGGSALLKLGTEVKFEIVNDDSGAVIYTEPVANYLEGTARRVSIEIYDDNDLFGDCTLTVVGELNPALTNVPPEFQDSYNVRYTRKVYISGAGVNTQPILFYKQPRIHVKEIVKPYITTNIPTGSITSTGTLKGSPILEDVGTTTNTQTEEQPAKFLKRKKKSLRSKLFGGGGNNSFIRKGRRRVRRSSPEADRYTMERLSGVNFDSRMVDAKLRVISASVASSFDIQSYHQVPDLFTTDIEDVKNSTTIVPDKPFTIIDTRFNATDPQREVIVPIESANFTVEFTPIPTQSLSTVNFRSYGDIRISRLRTFSGDIDRIKVYARNNDAFGDFEQISDQQIESPELLFNVFGAGNQSLGFFLEQNTIDTYWLKSANASATLTSDTMLNAVAISGSNQGFDEKLTFTLDGTYEMPFNDETEYEISFRAIGRKGPKNNFNGNSGQKGRMGVFLSGSAFTINQELGDDLGFQLETTDGTPAFLEVDTGDQEDFDLVSEVFKPTFDGKGVVKFVVFSGNFELSDVSIKPASSTGFSPNFVQVIAPVPELTSERPDNYEFVAEFYDVNNNVAETIGFASASSFSGGNNYIAGGDNLLSGSVFVGSAIGGGIEMAGVSSGLIRSIGYDGFVSASEYPYSGSPGFMFFSGSVFPGSGDDYKGVGLELFGNTGSFFRYRSDPATLEIVTKQFFVGTSGSGNPEQYISGSNGNVEISSSDFHLTPEGNVTASSILLGSKDDGQFLQFVGNQLTVQGNLSVDQIRTPALINNVSSTALNASASIDQFGFAKFTSASIAGWTINTSSIQDVNASGKGIVIQSDPSLPFIDVKEDEDNKVRLYHASDSNWGIIGRSGGSNIFRFGDTNKIASWTFNDKRLSSFKTATQDKFGISIDADYQLITFHGDSGEGKNNIGDNDRDNVMLAIGQLTDDVFGIKGFNTAGNRVFELSPTRNEIAGWIIGNQTLEGGDLILSKDGSIRSRGYQSDVAGSGFILTAASGGFLEVENAKIRGTLATAVFEKESVNAVGGQLYVANSTVLTSSIIAPDGNHTAATATMSVVNASGFVAGEIISAKKVSDTGFQTEYMRVNSSSRASTDDTDLSGFLMVTRAYGSGTTGESGSLGDIPSAAQGYSGSQVIVSTGRVGTGYIRINANPSDQATPYIDIVERTGVGLYDVELKARLGDLSGVAGSRNVPMGFTGFGLMSEVAFLSGSNIKLEAPSFLLGDKHKSFVSGSSSNIEVSASAFHLQPDGKLIFGDKSNSQYVEWDNSSLVVRGDLSVDSLTTPSTIDGSPSTVANASSSITSEGFASFKSASIGGFEVSTNQINSSNGRLVLKDSGQMTGSATLIGDKGAGQFLQFIDGTLSVEGSITANNIRTPSSIDGAPSTVSNASSSIDSQGFASFKSASIGGFTINDREIKSGTNIGMSSANKAFTINSTTFGNTGVQLEYNGGTPRAFIGSSTKFFKFDGSDVDLATDKFVIGNLSDAYISGSSGNIEISSSGFHLQPGGGLEVGVAKLLPSAEFLRLNHDDSFPVDGGVETGATSLNLKTHLRFNEAVSGSTAMGVTQVCDGDESIDFVGSQLVSYDEGIVGTSMFFGSGSSSLRADNIGYSSEETGVTYSFWMKPKDVTTQKDQILIVHTAAGTTSTSEGIMIRLKAGKIVATVQDGGAIAGFSFAYLASTTTLAADTWYHVAVVFDTGTDEIDIIINGVLDAQLDLTDPNISYLVDGLGNYTTAEMGIGGGYNATSTPYYMFQADNSSATHDDNVVANEARCFYGHIDDVRIYSDAKSAITMLALFHSYIRRITKPNFKINPTTNELLMNTTQFLLGSKGHSAITGSNFISGSNGNLEIFSDRFHLKPDGSLDMKGTINLPKLRLDSKTDELVFKDENTDYIRMQTRTEAISTNGGNSDTVETITTGYISLTTQLTDLVVQLHSQSRARMIVSPGRLLVSCGDRSTQATTNPPMSEGDREHAINGINGNYSGDTYQNRGISDNIHAGVTGANPRGVGGGLKVGVYGHCNNSFTSVGVLAEGRYRLDSGTYTSSAFSLVARWRPFVVGNPWHTSNTFSNGRIGTWSPGSADEATIIAYPIDARADDGDGDDGDQYRGRVGIGTWKPDELLDVNGNITCTSLTETSDIRKKKNIIEIKKGLSLLTQLQAVQFEWKDEFLTRSNKHGMKGKHYGFIAQDVEEIIPDVVTTEQNEEQYKNISYTEMIPLMVESIKELKQIIDEQQKQIDELKKEL